MRRNKRYLKQAENDKYWKFGNGKKMRRRFCWRSNTEQLQWQYNRIVEQGVGITSVISKLETIKKLNI